jgi:uncharacterized protein YodC (DUF2158 family)
MPALTKWSSVAVALVLVLGIPLSPPALSSPISSPCSIESQTTRQLQSGDLVRLRSGGPLMTVNRIFGDQVDCSWTDENGQPNDAVFPASVLHKF